MTFIVDWIDTGLLEDDSDAQLLNITSYKGTNLIFMPKDEDTIPYVHNHRDRSDACLYHFLISTLQAMEFMQINSVLVIVEP
ncbi:hypothetical protein SprV_0301025000 [Sparganum proliferum]